MLPIERRKRIVELVTKKTFVTVEELSQALFSSESTIRRDLVYLEKEGVIRKTHGGAGLLREDYVEWPLLFRQKDNTDLKEIIANKAISHVKNDQTLFIDSSSTCFFLAKKLVDFKGLTILTNGLMTAHFLSENTDFTVITCPGTIYSKGGSINGPDTCEYIARHFADIAFVSCRGIDKEFGVTDFTQAEAQVKRVFKTYSSKIAVLADQTKFNKRYFYLGIPYEEIDYLVTNE